jgi:hypothetical protein
MRRKGCRKGYQIDWNRDPISGEQYAPVFSQLRFSPLVMRPGKADVKGPWEVSRCQQFPILGQAYWLTGDERFAECFAGTIKDFIEKNKPGIGVHWACPMDVALRTVSWLSGLSFFQGSGHLNIRWWRMFTKSLVQHGRHITNNLEFGTLEGRIIVSNHGLANLFGLYWLSLNFPGLDAGCVWRGIAETGLEQQVQLQILSDGGGFESSIPYHRLVTEMFLSAYALSLHHGIPLSAAYRDQLVKALEFIKTLAQPNGRQPQIGDADNGRAHIFSGYGAWESEQENMDHLLMAGAVVLNMPDLAMNIKPVNQLEGLFWSDRPPIYPGTNQNQESLVKIYPNAGLGLIKQNDFYVLMNNSVCGTFGIGNHKHNDQLAVEWVIGNTPLLVDGGSYTYTQDPDARNWFRSTSHHNTLQIDGLEQHNMDPSALFRLAQSGEANWMDPVIDNQRGLGIRARHTGYARNSMDVIHERRVMLSKDNYLIIDDIISNAEGHTQVWYFLVHPEVGVELQGNLAVLNYSGGSAFIEVPHNIAWELESGWYSPGYGTKVKTSALMVKSNSLSEINFCGSVMERYRQHSFSELVRDSKEFWHGS